MSISGQHTFGVKGDQFVLDGKPFQIISGEMHYPRIPQAYWRDRLKKAKAMGLNTICTYIFWNAHEPKPGKFDFKGNLDLVRFIEIAQEEGLWVIVRPGPYVCSEWDFGGFPSWLLKNRNTVVRTMDPRYLSAAKRYFQEVAKQLQPLLLKNGGPVIMAQVENEYGSYGTDHAYMAWVEQTMIEAGFDCQLFTSDGSSKWMLSGGTLPHLPATINFGGNAEKEFANLAKFRATGPKMNTEFWCGWFDHWGCKHSTTNIESHVKDLKWMLAQGISVNFYVFHGGTNFGFTAGSNHEKAYEPDTTSYDYDAPLDEAGRPTPKYEAFRQAIAEHLGKQANLPSLPEPIPLIKIPSIELKPLVGLLPSTLQTKAVKSLPTMEDLNQIHGLLLYRKKMPRVVGKLAIEGLHDTALILVDGKPLGELQRDVLTSIDLNSQGALTLDILVTSLGRVNFGAKIVSDSKGIVGRVTLNDTELEGWEIASFPLDRPQKLTQPEPSANAPAFYKGTFDLKVTGDTFLDMSKWGFGMVWVNGHNLGRYWHIGPQQALYLPGPWLKQGQNEVVVLDLLDREDRMISGVTDPIWS